MAFTKKSERGFYRVHRFFFIYRWETLALPVTAYHEAGRMFFVVLSNFLVFLTMFYIMFFFVFQHKQLRRRHRAAVEKKTSAYLHIPYFPTNPINILNIFHYLFINIHYIILIIILFISY